MSEFERQARLAKAQTIAATCRDHGWSGADIVGLNQTERAWLCEVANVNVASPQTWAVVIGLLGAEAVDAQIRRCEAHDRDVRRDPGLRRDVAALGGDPSL